MAFRREQAVQAFPLRKHQERVAAGGGQRLCRHVPPVSVSVDDDRAQTGSRRGWGRCDVRRAAAVLRGAAALQHDPAGAAVAGRWRPAHVAENCSVHGLPNVLRLTCAAPWVPGSVTHRVTLREGLQPRANRRRRVRCWCLLGGCQAAAALVVATCADAGRRFSERAALISRFPAKRAD